MEMGGERELVVGWSVGQFSPFVPRYIVQCCMWGGKGSGGHGRSECKLMVEKLLSLGFIFKQNMLTTFKLDQLEPPPIIMESVFIVELLIYQV